MGWEAYAHRIPYLFIVWVLSGFLKIVSIFTVNLLFPRQLPLAYGKDASAPLFSSLVVDRGGIYIFSILPY